MKYSDKLPMVFDQHSTPWKGCKDLQENIDSSPHQTTNSKKKKTNQQAHRRKAQLKKH